MPYLRKQLSWAALVAALSLSQFSILSPAVAEDLTVNSDSSAYTLLSEESSNATASLAAVEQSWQDLMVGKQFKALEADPYSSSYQVTPLTPTELGTLEATMTFTEYDGTLEVWYYTFFIHEGKTYLEIKGPNPETNELVQTIYEVSTGNNFMSFTSVQEPQLFTDVAQQRFTYTAVESGSSLELVELLNHTGMRNVYLWIGSDSAQSAQ